MKKIVSIIVSFALVISMTACSATMSKTITNKTKTKQQSNSKQIKVIPNTDIPVQMYFPIEDAFVQTMRDIGYTHMRISNTQDITAESLEQRTSDVTIVERAIGIVTNKERIGDGIILNTDSYYNYISYSNTDLEYSKGTVMITYFVYNPYTNYVDDIVERYDYVLDRRYEE